MQIGDELPEMWLDADKIDQIIANLLENAVRHGSGHVTIEVAAWRLRPRTTEQPQTAASDGEPECA